ncbi:MAG TPA: tRNA 4-thiouridine(8) synthase ThiI [Candidatus Margulisiibacteriota bacterium]|nr:tRNA 4-thiouridine(8) synthase ThiI [Candidatus Margulisiibacteriota bacterium]
MKAIALISGGLDSLLAARLIQEQDIEVIPLHFKIPFCQEKKDNPGNADLAARALALPLKTSDIAEDFLRLLAKPKHGFGSQKNPCIDCKILMLAKAKKLMGKWGAGFVITGEVLGQRPMSQHKKALQVIERESGLEGLILRPLSAKLLAETIPEKSGWVKRDKLLSFSGRRRRPQMTLALEFMISKYANPAGGCLLTDPEFARRLNDLMAHQELKLEDIELLKLGRHFRVSQEAKLVVGRDESENLELTRLARSGDYLFMPTENMAGPTSLGRGKFNPELIRISCGITCRYCDLNGKSETEIIYRLLPTEECNVLSAACVAEKDFLPLRI